MKQYIGNFHKCDELINEIKNHTVETFHGHMELDASNPFYNEYIYQTELLKSAGYDDKTVEYRHYQSGIHFSEQYAQLLGEITNCTPIMCWVSELRPGKCTPWHWDINPWEEEHKLLGELARYFCFLSKPAPGHIFVTEQDAYYAEPQGTIYQYEDIHSWHAGTNVGLVPKYLLTFTGYK